MKIKITKFKRVENLEVEIPSMIEGGNGTGKTTILEAISFVLTGKNLDGKEFEQLYDNRVDLHDALAEVAYYDDFNNEFKRVVKPTFETSRSGEETLKILRSTRCTKNSIDVKDFAGEFENFYKFGTDYFFNQKEQDQRSIFIELMKSLLPDYDVKQAQLELTSLKKTQKNTVQEIKEAKALIKELNDVDVKEVPGELQQRENEYREIIKAINENKVQIEHINAENNKILSDFDFKRMGFNSSLIELESNLLREVSRLENLKSEYEIITANVFEPAKLYDVKEIEAERLRLKNELEATPFYQDFKEFAKKNYTKNQIVVKNIEKIKEIENGENADVYDVCPACGVRSEAALAKSIELQIASIKRENIDLLTIDMREANNTYLAKKDELSRVENKLNSVVELNVVAEKQNKKLEREFQINKTNKLQEISKHIELTTSKIENLKSEIESVKQKIEQLRKPALKQIPESLSVSDELQQYHSEFEALKVLITKAEGVNENNEKPRSTKESEIKNLQSLVAEIDSKIVNLENAISEYFSNLNGVVEKEFSGAIKIGVQLQQYVITKKEYKDCFVITANDKVFPSECNGALINNVKLQILGTLQRLVGYNGITIMDNVESNTTQQLESNGLNLVAAKATVSDSISINC